MKIELIKILKTDLRRCFFSCDIWLFAVLLAFLLYFASINVIYAMEDAIGQLIFSLGTGISLVVLCILPVFPYALTYVKEWEECASFYWMIRTGVRPYILSKLAVTAFSGFMTVFIGFIVFLGIARMRLPLFDTGSYTGDCYAPLLESGRPYLYLLMCITHFGLSGALVATAAVWFSTFFPSRYLAAAAPVMLYFTANRITATWNIPKYLKAVNWIEGTYSVGSPGATLLFKFLLVTVLCVLMGHGAMKNVERRVLRD